MKLVWNGIYQEPSSLGKTLTQRFANLIQGSIVPSALKLKDLPGCPEFSGTTVYYFLGLILAVSAYSFYFLSKTQMIEFQVQHDADKILLAENAKTLLLNVP